MTDDYANWSARGRAPAEDEAGLRAALDEAGPTGRDAALALVDEAESGLDAATVAALTEVARTADDADTRQFAVEALGVAGAGTETVRAALDDGDEWVRAEAVVALSRADPGASDRLREALDDASGHVRRNALIALAKTGAAGEALLVDRIKNDPSPAVREYAAQFLVPAEDVERAERILAAVLARDPGSFVRAKAAESLGELGTDRAEQALETHGLNDRSDDVRRTAKQALASARGVDPETLEVGGGTERGGPQGRNGPGGPGYGPADERRPTPPGGADAPPGRIDDEPGPVPRGADAGTAPGPRGTGSGPVGSHPGPDPRPVGYTDQGDPRTNDNDAGDGDDSDGDAETDR